MKGLLKIFACIITATLVLTISWGRQKKDSTETITWKIDNTTNIGGYRPQLWGKPQIVNEKSTKAVSFNGKDDGMVLSKIPNEGWEKFTIEVLFKPASTGPVAPRFVHFQDSAMNRGTFEVRLTTDGQWYLDAFLKNGKTNEGLTLIDSTILHPADVWYWAAMVYDGANMTSYVNGKKELEGKLAFPPMMAGAISLGVRLNQVSWFKGLIRELRFHHGVLPANRLQVKE